MLLDFLPSVPGEVLYLSSQCFRPCLPWQEVKNLRGRAIKSLGGSEAKSTLHRVQEDWLKSGPVYSMSVSNESALDAYAIIQLIHCNTALPCESLPSPGKWQQSEDVLWKCDSEIEQNDSTNGTYHRDLDQYWGEYLQGKCPLQSMWIGFFDVFDLKCCKHEIIPWPPILKSLIS